MSQTEFFDQVLTLALEDHSTLIEKGKHYGDSWKKRGGVGAFMMAARKADRIENILKNQEDAVWDIFLAGERNTGDILDDIADLRRYLLLIEAEIITRIRSKTSTEIAEDEYRGADHD